MPPLTESSRRDVASSPARTGLFCAGRRSREAAVITSGRAASEGKGHGGGGWRRWQREFRHRDVSLATPRCERRRGGGRKEEGVLALGGRGKGGDKFRGDLGRGDWRRALIQGRRVRIAMGGCVRQGERRVWRLRWRSRPEIRAQQPPTASAEQQVAPDPQSGEKGFGIWDLNGTSWGFGILNWSFAWFDTYFGV